MDTLAHSPRGVGVASILATLLVLSTLPATSRAAAPRDSTAPCGADVAAADETARGGPPCSPPPCARSRVTLIAHRGTGTGTRRIDGRAYSEDTIPAFVEAMGEGADGFETDYWPTSDGRLVSHHDRTLDRMTDGPGRIVQRPWSYVRTVRNTSGAAVPTLRSVEDRLATYGGLRQQEIKDGSTFSGSALRQLVAVDRAHVGLAHVLVTSSAVATLRRVHVVAPRLRTGLIDRSATGRPRLSQVPGWVDVLAVDLRAADARYVRRARQAGHAVSVRKVNTVEQLHAALTMGVHRVITDRPDLLGRSC
jgi:glycerophosphoryl diester phosphodiesterase